MFEGTLYVTLCVYSTMQMQMTIGNSWNMGMEFLRLKLFKKITSKSSVQQVVLIYGMYLKNIFKKLQVEWKSAILITLLIVNMFDMSIPMVPQVNIRALKQTFLYLDEFSFAHFQRDNVISIMLHQV